MKVKYINTDKHNPNLSVDKIYYVIAIEFSNSDSMSGNYIKYRILNDMNQVIPYSARDFDVVSGKLSTSWVYNARSANDYTILPSEIAYVHFWEDFYNDDRKALGLFESTYLRIIMEEASAEEIKEFLLSNNEYEVSLFLRGLGNTSNNDFINEVIELVKKEFSLFSVFSKIRATPLLIECFNYLSKVGGDIVDELFLKYYENVEWQCVELDMIVNDFYSRQ
ncbi:hypothetical protein JYG23_04590 [Sedimentibacter sp. zth1]|uniref:hypothetical protein n=1 Tax=Sedimentibacter sp. zth1 TaxID=2816908 RepID=UPI001A936522|nr:hypothetical protein [Sedimentibacter sp. zth1]QSX06728.1 hypothetical protein JYG23_04590 [Sedimentibacter sp. zth1]